MNIDDTVWNFMQNHLGYSDEEMETFKENPVNADVLAKGPEIMTKVFVVKVVESHGCNSRHKKGDAFYFDGAGNLITKRCPERVCIYALAGLNQLIFAANELLLAGADPNQMRFKRAGCLDVGVQCGGWGHIAMEISVEDH